MDGRRFTRRTLLIAAATSLLVLVGFRTRHHQCSICGVQEYERTLFGFVVEPLSEREYDEWGNYDRWRERSGRACVHQFHDAHGEAIEMPGRPQRTPGT